MPNEPADLAKLQRNRLRAQADMFAAVAAHGTIIGTAREIALTEFFRGLVPKRYEVLSGAIASESNGKLQKSSNQLDVLVVDTFDYPTLLRTGDLAVVLAASVLIVVESKSDLERGKKFLEAMTQIGQAKLVAGNGTLTALFCFGAPTNSSTLRRWLEDVVAERKRLLDAANAAPSSIDAPPDNDAKTGSETDKTIADEASKISIPIESNKKSSVKKSQKPDKEPNSPKKKSKEPDKASLLDSASNYSAANLPDLILSDNGAIAIRKDADDGSTTTYQFFKTKDSSPTIVALASKVLSHASQSQLLRSVGTNSKEESEPARRFDILINHFSAEFEQDSVTDLDVTDAQPPQLTETE